MNRSTLRGLGPLTTAILAVLTLVATSCVAGPSDPESAAMLNARAREIHERVFTLDTHKDIDGSGQLATSTSDADPEQQRRYRERFDPTVRGTRQVDFPKMREGLYDCAFYIVYVGQRGNDRDGFRFAKQQAILKFNAIQRMCDKYPEHIALARTPAEARKIHGEGKLVACIGIENGYPMGEDLGLVEEFWLRGARYMSITHNRHNQLGDSHTPAEPLHGGLTDLGRQAVAKMNEVGIMVDISHASKTTMLQVLEHAKAPVIASHSGCRAIRDHTRNLDDEQLLALKANGGVIQCVALGDFVRDQSQSQAALDALRDELGLPSRWETYQLIASTDPQPPELQDKLAAFQTGRAKIEMEFPKADVSDFVDHIDHAVKLIGIEHVGISSDFDGGGGIAGWNNASETFNVTLEMVRRGYTEQQIEQIWSGNLLRVWQAVEDAATR